MNSNKKDIVTGIIVVLVVIGGVYLFRYLKKDKTITPSSSPVSYEFKKDFEESFNFDIPDNVNSIELKDISGGDGRGIATESEILADIDEPESGYFYEAWLDNGENIVSLGKLKSIKGGWLVEYKKGSNPGYNKVVVSLEKVDDKKIEKRILEGSF